MKRWSFLLSGLIALPTVLLALVQDSGLKMGSAGNTMPQNSAFVGAVVGAYNDIGDSDRSLAVGFNNWLQESGGGECSSAFVTGKSCSVQADSSAAMGENTHVYKQASIGLGHGIVVPNQGSAGTVMVGRYNKTSDYNGQDVAFGVGNGTSSVPSNALTVYANGNVTIKPQGDISSSFP